MASKTILFSDGKSIKMTFNEVKDKFTPMIYNMIKKANSKFVFNFVEEDDFKQELEIELWRAYKDYDPERKNCFSTYLYYKLMKGVRNVTYARYSLKNKNNGVFSISQPIGENDLKIEDLLSTDDTSTDNILYKELVDIVLSNITEKEKELLKILLDRKEYSVNDYAKKFNISRQAANQRVKKLQKKLQKIVAKEYLEIA